MIFLLTTALGYCQAGSTNKETPEFPKRVFLNGAYVTLFTDDLVAKIDSFRIDYAECFSNRNSLTAHNFMLDSIVEGQHTEILSLRIEVQTRALLTKQQDAVIEANEATILGLEKKNKKLRRNTGLLGGLIAVLAATTAVVALN